MSDYFVFIAAQKAYFPIDWMCRNLGVSRASYYRWTKPADPSPTAVRHRALAGHVRRVFEAAKGRAGRGQIVHLLAVEGVKVATATVGAIMREFGLCAVRMRAWKQTTITDPDARTAHIANHMLDAAGHRDFSSATPGTRLVGDITYSDRVRLVVPGDRDRSAHADWGSAGRWPHTCARVWPSTRWPWPGTTAISTSLLASCSTQISVLQRPVESGQYTSGDFQDWCHANLIIQSMGKSRDLLG